MESRWHQGQLGSENQLTSIGAQQEALVRLKQALNEAANVGLFGEMSAKILPDLLDGFHEEVGRFSLPTLASPREWISIETGDLPTFQGRIPLLSTKTPAGVFAWIAAMHDAGLTFHPDDDPEDIVQGLYGGRVFSDDEVPVVRKQLEAAREAVPEELIYLALDVASGMAKHRIDDALANSGWTVELGRVGSLIFEREGDPDSAVIWRVTDPRERFDGGELPAMSEDLGYALDTFKDIAALSDQLFEVTLTLELDVIAKSNKQAQRYAKEDACDLAAELNYEIAGVQKAAAGTSLTDITSAEFTVDSAERIQEGFDDYRCHLSTRYVLVANSEEDACRRIKEVLKIVEGEEDAPSISISPASAP